MYCSVHRRHIVDHGDDVMSSWYQFVVTDTMMKNQDFDNQREGAESNIIILQRNGVINFKKITKKF